MLVRSLFLSFFIIFTSPLLASQYNDDVLEIFAKLLPRFALMNNQPKKSVSHLGICILSNDEDKLSALLLKKKIYTNYPGSVQGRTLVVSNSDIDNLQSCNNSDILFLFNASEDDVIHVVRYSEKQKIMTVSYDASLLQDGVNISLFLGRKILPYINIDSLHKSNINMNNTVLQISKIYHDGNK